MTDLIAAIIGLAFFLTLAVIVVYVSSILNRNIKS